MKVKNISRVTVLLYDVWSTIIIFINLNLTISYYEFIAKAIIHQQLKVILVFYNMC